MKQLLLRCTALVVPFVSGCGPMDDTALDVSADGGCSDTWSGYGQTFFSGTCAGSCHGAKYTSQAKVQGARSAITSEISRGRMPTDQALSAQERSRVLAYLSCGAP